VIFLDDVVDVLRELSAGISLGQKEVRTVTAELTNSEKTKAIM
jgi:hypothetical protein